MKWIAQCLSAPTTAPGNIKEILYNGPENITLRSNPVPKAIPSVYILVILKSLVIRVTNLNLAGLILRTQTKEINK